MATAEKDKILNVPNLRFPEFTGEWEKRRLGEIGETLIGLTYSPDDVTHNGTGRIVLRSSNIKDGQIDYDDLVRVKKQIKERIITRENDILVCARNGSIRLIGKNAILTKEDEGNTFGAFMMVYRSEENSFVYQLLSTKRYYSQILENLGARINQVTTSDFNSFCFYFPPEKNERNKIASLFRLFNARIATQNKIIDKLQSLIKGLYQNFFSEIEAEPLRLGDVCKVVKGQQINGDQMVEKGKYYVMNGGTRPSGYYIKPNVNGNTISISEGGSCGYVQFNIEPFWSGGHCYTIENVSDFVNKMYLYHFLKANEKNLSKLGVGSGLPNIQKKDLENFMVLIPPVEMQLKISSVLSALERKMQCELSSTELFGRQKNYLLGQMFI